jgi:GT2 family glycosyltransferase
MISTSVIVPSYQGAHRLPALLESLSKQVSDLDWEVIVVLDGSTDDSAAVISEWSSRVPVRVIDLGTNQGRPAALNAGFSAAQGHVLIRCDDDLTPDQNYLERHTAHHRERDNLGVMGLCRNVMPETVYSKAYGAHTSELSLRANYATAEDHRWIHWAANCSVTRTMFDRVGPYDEQFRAYGWEDVDWGYRLALAGGSFIVDPDLEVDHHGAATTTAIRSRRAFLSGAARSRFRAKHGLDDGSDQISDRTWTLWNTAVLLASRTPSPFRERAAQVIDDVGGHLPTGITRKLIALSVESSGLAGARSGPDASKDLSRGI